MLDLGEVWPKLLLHPNMLCIVCIFMISKHRSFIQYGIVSNALIVFFLYRTGSIQQPFWIGLFLSKKMQCYPTLNGGKNCLSSALPLKLGKFSYLKTKVSCLFQHLHITKGTNNLYDIIHMLLNFCYTCCFW